MAKKRLATEEFTRMRQKLADLLDPKRAGEANRMQRGSARSDAEAIEPEHITAFAGRTFFWARCHQCGQTRHVKKFEVLPVAPPRCTRCGGIVELNEQPLEVVDQYSRAVSYVKMACQLLELALKELHQHCRTVSPPGASQPTK